MANETELNLAWCTEFEQVAAGEESTLLVMGSLTAPSKAPSDEKRAPINVVPVLDRSGSMHGSKLKLVKETAKFLIETVQETDQLGVVIFDDVVDTPFDISLMMNDNKELANNAIDSVESGGCTNLCGGLLKGIEDIRRIKTQEDGSASAVMLFTDGQANEGITDTEEIIKAMLSGKTEKDTRPRDGGIFGGFRNMQVMGNQANMMQMQQQTQMPQMQMQMAQDPPFYLTECAVEEEEQQQIMEPAAEEATAEVAIEPEPDKEKETEPFVPVPMPCLVHTFGYGTDTDAEMLKKIADAAHGMYYFIRDQENIASAFADCLGGLLSVVAQRVSLTFEAMPGVQIKKVLSRYRSEAAAADKHRMAMGDIQGEETRDVLCLVQLPAEAGTDQPVDRPIIRIKVAYYNVITKKDEQVSAIVTIRRPQRVEGTSEVNYSISKHRNRITAAEAMERAANITKAYNVTEEQLKQAREVLSDAEKTITASPSAQDPLCESLLTDIRRLLEDLSSRERYISKGGQHRLVSHANQHFQQRSAGYDDDEEADMGYMTSAKMGLIKKSKAYFKK